LSSFQMELIEGQEDGTSFDSHDDYEPGKDFKRRGSSELQLS